MSDLVPLLVGAALALAIAPGTLRTFAENGWTRVNHRGRALPFPGGAIAVSAGLLAVGLLAGIDRVAGTHLLFEDVVLVLDRARLGAVEFTPDVVFGTLLCLGVALLGALDDLLDAAPRGMRGHASALLRGRFSTGALKAAGTLALALVVLHDHDDLLLAVAVLVLATNAFNLLDLRPGRAGKAFVLLAAGLLVGTGDTQPLRALGAFAGALLVLAAFDLRERTMLGDTGANVLGAISGFWLVSVLDATGLLIALAALVVVTAYGELRSISALVERFTPLRALDRLGRPASPPPSDLH